MNFETSFIYVPPLLIIARGFFYATNVTQPLRMITKKDYNIPAFARHLKDFCDDTRGPILERRGKPNKIRYRFIKPLMEPYVTLRGLADGSIRESQLNRPSATATEPEQLSLLLPGADPGVAFSGPCRATLSAAELSERHSSRIFARIWVLQGFAGQLLADGLLDHPATGTVMKSDPCSLNGQHDTTIAPWSRFLSDRHPGGARTIGRRVNQNHGRRQRELLACLKRTISSAASCYL